MCSLTTAATTTAPAALLDTICSNFNCVNGQCYLIGTTPKCSCDTVFKGDACDIVDLSKVEFIIIGSMIIFKWHRPPRLNNYSFLYYRLDDPDMILYKRDILIGDHESSALVGNLQDGVADYQICIEKEDVADRAVLTQSMEFATNCVQVSTSPDYHTVFAWFIAGCTVVAAVLLIYWQRDKIELLYFNRAITINNGIYNYNVAELIRLEKVRKEREKEYELLHKAEQGQYSRYDKGTLNKMTLETIADE